VTRPVELAQVEPGSQGPGLARAQLGDLELARGEGAGAGVDQAIGERAPAERLRLDEDAAQLAG